MIKYYAGHGGFGGAFLIKVDLKYKPLSKTHGIYQIVEIKKLFFGTPPLESTHLAKSDVEQNSFDEFEDAVDHMVTIFKQKIETLQGEIDVIGQQIDKLHCLTSE